jgi:RNA polymerase sigma-70 factor (ECF subfamily)
VTASPDTFDVLYRTHAPSALRRARHMLGSDSDARELVHDVFLSLFERPEQYAAKSSMTTFLYSAVTHACLNRIRNGKTRLKLVAEHAHTYSLGPATSEGLNAEELSILHAELASLPEPLAQVAVYRFVDELTHDEIARVMGCSRRHVGDLLERLAARACDSTEASCAR